MGRRANLPPALANLAATATHDSVTLTWTNPGSQLMADFYRIQRRETGSDEWLGRDDKWINESAYVDRYAVIGLS